MEWHLTVLMVVPVVCVNQIHQHHSIDLVCACGNAAIADTRECECNQSDSRSDRIFRDGRRTVRHGPHHSTIAERCVTPIVPRKPTRSEQSEHVERSSNCRAGRCQQQYRS